MNTLNNKKASWYGRKKEIESYESEKKIHEATIANLPNNLPSTWPEKLKQLANAGRAALVSADLTDAEFQQVINLQLRDKSKGAIREIEFELNKCRSYLKAIEAELPEADRTPPANKLTAGFVHLEGMRLRGEINAYEVDETTITDFGVVGSAAVTITRNDLSKKRRVMFVDDDGEINMVHSSKPNETL